MFNKTQMLMATYVSQFVLQLVLIASAFFVTKTIVLIYGSEINGLMISINQFIAYFALAEAGIAGAAIYALYSPLSYGDNKKISLIFLTVKKMFWQSGGLFILLLMMFAYIYPLLVETEIVSMTEFLLLVFILSIPELFNFFWMSKYRVLLTADKKIYVLSYASIIFAVVNTFLIIYLANSGQSIFVAKGAVVLAILLQAFVVIRFCRNRYSYLDRVGVTNPSLLKQRGDVLTTRIMTSLHQGLPVVFITFFLTLSELSVFAIYNLLFMGIGGVVSILSNSIVPFFGEIFVRGDKRQFENSFKIYETTYFLVLSIVFVCAVLLASPFFELYTSGMNDADYDRPELVILFIILGITNYLKSPSTVLMQSSGLFRITRNQWIVQLAIAVIVAMITVHLLGLIGILVALITSNIYRDFSVIRYVSQNIPGVSLGFTLTQIFQLLFCMSFAILINNYFPFHVSDYISFFLTTLIIGILATFSVFAIFYIISNKETKYILKKLITMMREFYSSHKGVS
jgi:O-antigen/teichoic acid export membrane protein